MMLEVSELEMRVIEWSSQMVYNNKGKRAQDATYLEPLVFFFPPPSFLY